jgi:hypothetical protein
MNPLLIEQAMTSAVQTALAGTALSAATVYAGTSADLLTPESVNLVVDVETVTALGPGLYTTPVLIRLTAPALLGDSMYADMSAYLDALGGIMAASSISAAWPAGNSVSFFGSWLQETTTGREGDQWTAEMRLLIGIGAI